MRKKTHGYETRQQMLSSQYEIFHYSDMKLKNVSLHHHDFYECYYFISGDVTYLVEGRSYLLKPGDIILINSTELHQAIINYSTQTYERIVLWINKNFLKSLSTENTDLTQCFENKKENVFRATPEVQQSVKALLNKILSLESYHDFGKELLQKAYITELSVLLNSLVLHGGVKLTQDVQKSNLIEEVINYLNTNIEDDITIDKLSEQFYLSKYHLLREFKKHTGTTIHHYLVQKKLILAKKLILCGTPINNVYLQCGFGDYSNFFRAFKAEYGVTPKTFYQLMDKTGNTPDLI